MLPCGCQLVWLLVMAGLTEQDTNGSCLLYEQLNDRNKTHTIASPWKGPVDAHSMAEAGFVYTGQEDLVYCFSCNIELDGWTKYMDPLLRHKKESPTCSFVRQQLQVMKGEKREVKSVVAPSKPLNPQQTASIGQLVHVTHSPVKYTMVTGLFELRLPNEQTDHNHLGAVNFQSIKERFKSFTDLPFIQPSDHLNKPSLIPQNVPTPGLHGGSNKQDELFDTLESSADSEPKDDHHDVTVGVCTAQHTVVSTV